MEKELQTEFGHPAVGHGDTAPRVERRAGAPVVHHAGTAVDDVLGGEQGVAVLHDGARGDGGAAHGGGAGADVVVALGGFQHDGHVVEVGIAAGGGVGDVGRSVGVGAVALAGSGHGVGVLSGAERDGLGSRPVGRREGQRGRAGGNVGVAGGGDRDGDVGAGLLAEPDGVRDGLALWDDVPDGGEDDRFGREVRIGCVAGYFGGAVVVGVCLEGVGGSGLEPSHGRSVSCGVSGGAATAGSGRGLLVVPVAGVVSDSQLGSAVGDVGSGQRRLDLTGGYACAVGSVPSCGESVVAGGQDPDQHSSRKQRQSQCQRRRKSASLSDLS